MKLFRFLQVLVLLANCIFAAWVFYTYGMAVLHYHWPLHVAQTKTLLIGAAFLPVALLCLWVPVSGAVVQFACAYIGSTLQADTPMPELHQVAEHIMMAAGLVIVISILYFLTGVTHEAFGGPDTER